jgi:hypothetical protein
MFANVLLELPMNLSRPALLAGFALLLLAAAPPPAAPQAGPTPAQQAELRALGEKLGTCHRTHAVAGAATKASVDKIVASTIAACQAQVTPIRKLLAGAVGGEQADRMIASQQPHWREAVARIVAAARAAH